MRQRAEGSASGAGAALRAARAESGYAASGSALALSARVAEGNSPNSAR
jgi:hypothetical protein